MNKSIKVTRRSIKNNINFRFPVVLAYVNSSSSNSSSAIEPTFSAVTNLIKHHAIVFTARELDCLTYDSRVLIYDRNLSPIWVTTHV